MRTLMMVLVVLAICVAGLGFYRGWFSMSGRGGAGNKEVTVSLTLDPDQMREDAEKVEQRTAELTDAVAAKVERLGDDAGAKANVD